MLRLASWMKKLYKKRKLNREVQWPPCHGRKLVNLHLVERDAFVSEQKLAKSRSVVKHTPIKYSELFQSKSGEEEIQSVLLEGHAGIGKTTFCTILTEEWGKDELFQQFKLVLLLPLRDLRIATAQSISDLVKRLKNDDKLCNSVIEEFDENGGENVLIVADGWDELSESQRSEGQFLYNLLIECSELPNASILLTSRPSASASLHELQCFDRYVQVIGFNRSNIEEYFNSELSPENASLLIEQLDHNPMIESICTVPLNCAIVCHLFRELGEVLPSTMTELYTKIILLIIARNIAKKYPEYGNVKSLINFHTFPEPLQTYWWLLCEFALWAMEKDKIVFSHNEIERFFPKGRASVDANLNCFGLMQSFDALLSEGVRQGLSFNFLHLTIQEYLAAFHLVRLPSEKQLEFCVSHTWSVRYDTVWRFFFGIGCNNHLLANESDTVLQPIVSQEVITEIVYSKNYNMFISMLCHCSFEANTEYVNTLIAEVINGQFDLAFGALTAHDCSAAIHVLSHTQAHPTLTITFRNCSLGDRGMVPLANALTQKSSHLQKMELNLSGNNLTETGVNTLFSIDFAFRFIVRLDLSNNKIGEEGVRCIMSTISIGGLSNLSFLYLSHNPLGVSGIQALEDGVCTGILSNLKELSLAQTLTSDSSINGAVLTIFLQSLSTACPKLTSLNLSDNHLGVPGGQAVANALPKLTRHQSGDFELHLLKTNLGDKGIRAFTQSLPSPCHLRKFTINDNALYHDAAVALSESIISGALIVNSLFIGDNPLGLQGLAAICRMLSSRQGQLERLYMANCSVTSIESNHANGDSDVARSDVIKQLQQLPVNKSIIDFNLSKNDFSGNKSLVLLSIMSLCSSVQYLSTTQCNITSEYLFFHLFNEQECSRLRSWYLSQNKINDDGIHLLLKNLATALPCITAIDLSQNPVSEEMVRRLKAAIQKQRKETSRNVKKEKRRQKLRDAVMMGLSEDDKSVVETLLRKDSTELNLTEHLKRKSLLILVYIEAVYMLFPGYPHHPPTVTLEVVNRVDEGMPWQAENNVVIYTTLLPLKHVFSPGLRVVRGRDWEVDDEDGGEGHVGTVLKISEPFNGGRTALVQWDCSKTGQYRCGMEGKFDLRVIDSTPTGLVFSYVRCDSCNQGPVYGMRWKCSECRDYDLCTHCYHKGKVMLEDSLKHNFIRYDRDRHSLRNSLFRVQVPPRAGARRIETRGIFPGAVVVRGPDWNHGDDDGGDGGTGTVTRIISCNNAHECQEGGGVEVEWKSTKIKTTCRLGWEGKVDVNCIFPSSGGYYYPDHLPMLGAPYSVQQEQADRVREEQETESQVQREQHNNEKYFSGIDVCDSPGFKVATKMVQSKQPSDDEYETASEGDEVLVNERFEESNNGQLNVDDLKCVRTAVWDVRSQWYNVGIELDVNTSSLDAIREDCHHKVDQCFTAMLKVWLQRFHPPPTWSALVEALRSPPVNIPHLAQELEKKFIQNPPTPMTMQLAKLT